MIVNLLCCVLHIRQTRLYWRPSVKAFNNCFHVMVSVTSRRAGRLSPPGTTSQTTAVPLVATGGTPEQWHTG